MRGMVFALALGLAAPAAAQDWRDLPLPQAALPAEIEALADCIDSGLGLDCARLTSLPCMQDPDHPPAVLAAEARSLVCRLREALAWDALIERYSAERHVDLLAWRGASVAKGLDDANRAFRAYREAACTHARDAWSDTAWREGMLAEADCRLMLTAARAADVAVLGVP